jgi:hypothetical protein
MDGFPGEGIFSRPARPGPTPLESGFGFRTFKGIRPVEMYYWVRYNLAKSEAVRLSLE